MEGVNPAHSPHWIESLSFSAWALILSSLSQHQTVQPVGKLDKDMMFDGSDASDFSVQDILFFTNRIYLE